MHSPREMLTVILGPSLATVVVVLTGNVVFTYSKQKKNTLYVYLMRQVRRRRMRRPKVANKLPHCPTCNNTLICDVSLLDRHGEKLSYTHIWLSCIFPSCLILLSAYISLTLAFDLLINGWSSTTNISLDRYLMGLTDLKLFYGVKADFPAAHLAFSVTQQGRKN